MVDHVQLGRRYLPRLVATGVLHIADWVRDDLPDLVWPVLVLSLHGTEAARDFVRWQGAVQDDLRRDVEPQVLANELDGRLTGLQRLAASHPGSWLTAATAASAFDAHIGVIGGDSRRNLIASRV